MGFLPSPIITYRNLGRQDAPCWLQLVHLPGAAFVLSSAQGGHTQWRSVLVFSLDGARPSGPLHGRAVWGPWDTAPECVRFGSAAGWEQLRTEGNSLVFFGMGGLVLVESWFWGELGSTLVWSGYQHKDFCE